MLTYIHKVISKWRWDKYYSIISNDNTPLIKRAKLSIGLINKYNVPVLNDYQLSKFSITSYTYDLQTLLLELEKYTTEFENGCNITPAYKPNDIKTIELNRWKKIDNTKPFTDVNLYTGYLIASKFIYRLLKETNSDNTNSYIFVRCGRVLNMYVMLTMFLGIMAYEK